MTRIPTTELKNVTSLMFQEDEVGFLAGVLAAGMSKTGTVCSVRGMEIPPVVRFVVGYQNGAKWMNPNIKTLNVYIPSFTDPAKGKEVGQSMIGQGCDVVFGVGGNTGNGGLLAAKEKGLMAIGVDVDQYLTYPEVKAALLTSAAKNVDVAVFDYLKEVKDGTVEARHRDRQPQEQRPRPGPVPRLGEQSAPGGQGQGHRGGQGSEGRYHRHRLQGARSPASGQRSRDDHQLTRKCHRVKVLHESRSTFTYLRPHVLLPVQCS